MENITDSELLKIAENWEKEQPINIGIKTAFAAGYRMAEIKAKNCTIRDVSLSVCECAHGFKKKGYDKCAICGKKWTGRKSQTGS
jgi:hypothetical protein